MDSKLLKEFLEEQPKLLQSKTKAKKAHQMLINPEAPKEELDEYTYICTKKPAKKRVEKSIQGLIDAIVEANED